MKKVLFGLFAIIALPAATTFALVDACGQEFTYTSEANDSRVLIDTFNTPAMGHPDSITVNAKDGYEVVSIKIELDSNDTPGWDIEVTGPRTNFNPVGSDIEQFEVVVKKVCTEVCNDETASNYTAVVEGTSVENNALCVYPDPEPEPDPEPTDLCSNVDGVQTEEPCADSLCDEGTSWNTDTQQCVAPEPEPEPAPEPDPAPAPAPAASTPAPHTTSGGGGFTKCTMWAGWTVGSEHRCMTDNGTIMRTMDWQSGTTGTTAYFAQLESIKQQLLVILATLNAMR